MHRRQTGFEYTPTRSCSLNLLIKSLCQIASNESVSILPSRKEASWLKQHGTTSPFQRKISETQTCSQWERLRLVAPKSSTKPPTVCNGWNSTRSTVFFQRLYARVLNP